MFFIILAIEMITMITSKGKKAFFLTIMYIFNMIGITAAVEFNAEVLADLGFGEVDLSAFSGSSDQYSGEHSVDIFINDARSPIISNWGLTFYQQDDQSEACITPALIAELPLKKEVLKNLKGKGIVSVDDTICLPLASLDPAIIIAFDGKTQELTFALPQAFLDNYDENWVPPQRRDHGISGLFTDYSLVVNHDRRKQQDSETNIRGIGVLGANVGMLRFRANYQYDNKNRYGKKFEWVQKYTFIDIGSLNAKLYAGEIYSRTSVFESVRIKGLSLFTDTNMMPNYLLGYAPVVAGVATTNAIVTVRQGDRVLNTVQVTPGPFEISDLPSYITGILDIEIEEATGEIRRFQMDVASVPFLARKGTARYAVNIGKTDDFGLHKAKDKNYTIVSADGTYGLTGDISVYGGVFSTTHKDGYQAYNAGVGMNLGSLGALSMDVTRSVNKAVAGEALKGHSYRFNYAKKFQSGTNLNLVGYRFSSRNYTSFNNFLEMSRGYSRRVMLEKTRFTLSLSQYFEPIDGSVSISATRGTYWNQSSMENYNISYNTTLEKCWAKGIGIHLTATKNKGNDRYGYGDTSFGLFITIPIQNDFNKRVQYNATYQKDSKQFSQGATYYDKVWDGYASMSARTNGRRDFSGSIYYSLDASYHKDLSLARVQGNASYSEDYQRISGSIDSSITLTQHGVAVHPRVYDNAARLVVDTGVKGVSFTDGYTKSNIFGLAGISNVPSYNNMTYTINNDTLPADIDIQNGVMKLAVSDGAIAYRTTGAIQGEKIVAIVRRVDGSYPPFGAVIQRENGLDTEVAMIAGDGLTYLTGVNTRDKFIVRWSGEQCSLHIEDLSNLDSNGFYNLTGY